MIMIDIIMIDIISISLTLSWGGSAKPPSWRGGGGVYIYPTLVFPEGIMQFSKFLAKMCSLTSSFGKCRKILRKVMTSAQIEPKSAKIGQNQDFFSKK